MSDGVEESECESNHWYRSGVKSTRDVQMFIKGFVIGVILEAVFLVMLNVV